ncbi:hypothetical protein [Bacillus sp. FJAT-52991]|uniref:Uncharacterized protein n=1 Tax=Bacillus kandeliae TaxID=3129297 RepID=A0ABZ2N637_9BACI
MRKFIIGLAVFILVLIFAIQASMQTFDDTKKQRAHKESETLTDAGTVSGNDKNSSEVTIPIDDKQYIKVRMNTNEVPLTYHKRTTDVHIRSTDTHYYYHMGDPSKPLGSMRVTLRKLDNGDVFVFTKFVNNSNSDYSASVIMPFQQSDHYTLTKYESYGKVNQTHDSTFGVDPTSHPIGILSTKKGNATTNEVMMGKNYVSLHRQQNYSNGQKSVLREFKDEYESYQIYEDKEKNLITSHLNMSVKGKSISENWALISQKPLFASATNRDEWFKRTIKEYRVINKWLTADGAYTKLPWSIEPSYKMGFGRSIGNLEGSIYLDAYSENKERYFYDLVINSIADLDTLSKGALTAGKSPIFLTEYTSTYLKEPYGFTAPYVDTRHNEKAALFLKNSSEILNIPELKNVNLRYADFLVDQKEAKNVINITPSGYLIADYYSPESKVITHASLNHALGEMRLLLETYQQTNNPVYLNTAQEIQAGIENLYPGWIRSNGDLWYHIDAKKNFGGTDYTWLTLMDLLLNQKELEEVGLSRSPIFDKMIRSKATYLVDNKIAIKPEIISLLKEQGFDDLANRAISAETHSKET